MKNLVKSFGSKKQAMAWLVSNLANQYSQDEYFWLVTDITSRGDKVKKLYHHLCYCDNNGNVVGKDDSFTVVLPKKTWAKIKRLACV